MLAFLKRRHFAIALLLGLSLLLPLFYFTFGKNRNQHSAQLNRSADSATTVTSSNSAHSVSLDSDSDGIPDAAELQSYMDRENFRRWFTLIAEAQFYRLSGEWNAEQRDCAGLVRFAWREALRRHDRP